MKSLYTYIVEGSKDAEKDIKLSDIVQRMRKNKLNDDIWDNYDAEVVAAICNNDYDNDDYGDLKKNNPKYVIYQTLDDEDFSDYVIDLIQTHFKAYKNSKDEHIVLTKKPFSKYDGVLKLVLGYYLTNTDSNYTQWLKNYNGSDKEKIVKLIYEQ